MTSIILDAINNYTFTLKVGADAPHAAVERQVGTACRCCPAVAFIVRLKCNGQAAKDRQLHVSCVPFNPHQGHYPDIWKRCNCHKFSSSGKAQADASRQQNPLQGETMMQPVLTKRLRGEIR
jgi:hypothetical protein